MVISCVSLIVALAAAEAALRFLGVPVEFNPEREVFGKTWTQTMHRPSELAGLDYELAPDLEIDTGKHLIKTNSMGFRSPEIKSEKGAGVRRALMLGDSFTFAFGTKRENTCPAVLERLLEDGKEVNLEIVNMGVSGYGSKDEAALFLNRGSKLAPDLVIMQYFLNDPNIGPVQPLSAHYRPVKWWQRFNLTRLVYKLLWQRKIEKLGDGDYYRYLHNDPGSWRSVERSFEKLGEWSTQHKVPLLLVIFPALDVPDWPLYPYSDLHSKVAESARRQGFVTADLYRDFKKYTKEELTLSADNFHPSAKAHEVAAQRLAEEIEKNFPGLLKKAPQADQE